MQKKITTTSATLYTCLVLSLIYDAPTRAEPYQNPIVYVIIMLKKNRLDIVERTNPYLIALVVDLAIC